MKVLGSHGRDYLRLGHMNYLQVHGLVGFFSSGASGSEAWFFSDWYPGKKPHFKPEICFFLMKTTSFWGIYLKFPGSWYRVVCLLSRLFPSNELFLELPVILQQNHASNVPKADSSVACQCDVLDVLESLRKDNSRVVEKRQLVVPSHPLAWPDEQCFQKNMRSLNGIFFRDIQRSKNRKITSAIKSKIADLK